MCAFHLQFPYQYLVAHPAVVWIATVYYKKDDGDSVMPVRSDSYLMLWMYLNLAVPRTIDYGCAMFRTIEWGLVTILK